MPDNQSMEVMKPIEMSTQQKLVRAMTVAGDYLFSVDSRLDELRNRGTPEISLKALKTLAFFKTAAFLGWTRIEASNDLISSVVSSEKAENPENKVSLDLEKFLRDVQLHKLFSPREEVERLNQLYDWASEQELVLEHKVVQDIVSTNPKFKLIIEDPANVHESGVMRRLNWMEKSVAWAYYRLMVVDATRSNLEVAQDSGALKFWQDKERSAIGDFKISAYQAVENYVCSKYGKKKVNRIIGDNLSLGNTRWNQYVNNLMPNSNNRA